MGDKSCSWVRDRLPLLAGDELAAPDRPEVRRHLLGCPSCRRRLEQLRDALRMLHLAADESPVSADAPSIWPELSRQIRESRRPAPGRSLSFSWSWAGPGLALAAGLLLASLLRVPRPGPAPGSPRTSAPAPVVVVPEVRPAPTTVSVRHEAPPAKLAARKPAPAESGVKSKGRSKKDALAAEVRPPARGDAEADRAVASEQPTH